MTSPDNWRDWIGKSQVADGEIFAWPSDVLNATLDRDHPPLASGDAIPPGWHWLYFPEVVRLSDVGADGHAKRGEFLPPVPLPRRMWASNRMQFHQPLRVGEKLSRVSTIADVTTKEGRSGLLVFVIVRHEVSGEHGLATVEEHTIVYRDRAKSTTAKPVPRAPDNPTWVRVIEPTPVLLFRFSALTMNSHRIHYDRAYTNDIEGYPGLLVHGPLVAILLLDLFHREMPRTTLNQFSIRVLTPLYDTGAFTIAGRPEDDGKTAKLWALNNEGALAALADVEYECVWRGTRRPNSTIDRMPLAL